MATTVPPFVMGGAGSEAIRGQIRGRFWICVARQKAGLPISESYIETVENLYEMYTAYFVSHHNLDPARVLPLVDAFGAMNHDVVKALPSIFLPAPQGLN